MKTISFQVPTKRDFIKWRDIILFKINGGFRCTGCGSKMFFDTIEISQHNFLFHNSTKRMCTDCTINDINNNPDKIFTEECTCDWCNDKTRKSTRFFFNADIKSNITFGMNWWNGFNICQHCLNEELMKHKGKESSSHYELKNGTMYPVNSLGIPKNE